MVTFVFITKLPKSKEPMTNAEYDSILVLVEKLTKYASFIPYKESSTAEELVYTIIRHITRKHGMPEEFITNRNTKMHPITNIPS
jgi:hypothetical protein